MEHKKKQKVQRLNDTLAKKQTKNAHRRKKKQKAKPMYNQKVNGHPTKQKNGK